MKKGTIIAGALAISALTFLASSCKNEEERREHRHERREERKERREERQQKEAPSEGNMQNQSTPPAGSF